MPQERSVSVEPSVEVNAMIWWGVVVGALVGWSLPGWDGFGFLPGAMFGLFAGWLLRSAVRREIARSGDALRRQLLDMIADGGQAMAVAGTAAPIADERSLQPAVPATSVSVPLTAAEPPLTVAEPPGTAAAALAPDPVAPRIPAPPNAVERLIAIARAWIFGGNTIVRAGLVILFVGLSFLASYAASAGLFPIELRLALIVAAGVALLVVGFRTRLRRPNFAVALQGTGVAAIYLTVFAGGLLFGVIPPLLAFAILVLVCALSCALALLQDAESLAVAAFLGGFAVLLLLGSAGGSAALFGYVTVLNLAVLFFARARRWRVASLLGFFATFGVATLWGLGSYTAADYPAAQAFLILSVAIYVATALFSARSTPGVRGKVVDTTLLLGPAIAGFGLQVGLVQGWPLGSAFSALGFAGLYILVAAIMIRRGRDELRVMNEAMLAIGVGFVTLAVPLALGARWTSSAWALEGAGAFWIGMRQARWMPRLFGVLLQLFAAFVFLAGIGSTMSALPFVDPGFVGATLVALAALATAWWLRTPLAHSGSRWALGYASVERGLQRPAFLFGFAFWWLALSLEAMRVTPPTIAGAMPSPAIDPGIQPLLIMLAFVVSAVAATWLGRRRGWEVALWPGRMTLAVLALTLMAQTGRGEHVLYTPGWAIWLAAFALHYWLLYRDETPTRVPEGAVLGPLHRIVHIGGAWLVTLVIADCLWLGVDRGGLWNTSWAGVSFLVSIVAALLLLTLWAGAARPIDRRAQRWPLREHVIDYGWYAALPIAATVLVGALATALIASGTTAPLPYVPLLNPIDLTLMLAIGALLLWRRTMLAADPAPPHMAWLRERVALVPLAGLAFIVVNTVWLRIAHHVLGVAWNTPALLDSFVVQMGIAILWTLLALGLMLYAHRRPNRIVWITGAALLGLVVVKLLLVDLNNEGGAVRIVTFLVVGVLMLVVGYFAPLPPKTESARSVGDSQT